MSELKFIETTDETIYTDILEELENGVGEPLYPGDERRIFGDTMAKVIVIVAIRTEGVIVIISDLDTAGAF